MKKIVFSLLLLFWCTITSAQNKSEVLDAVRKTVEEYFMPDFNDAIEFPEWRNPDNAEGLASCSRVYIEPNHFFRNGKVCSSYAAWVNQYCSQKLHGKVIEHILTLDENLQKVKGDNDLYRIEASLERKWVIENGPDIPTEKIILTFQWRGAGKLVYIMQMDGDISPIQLPVPVKTPALQQTTEIFAAVAANYDYISNSSLVGYFLDELIKTFQKDKKTIGWVLFLSLLLMLIGWIWNYMKTKKKEGGEINLWVPIRETFVLYLIFIIFISICYIGALAISMFSGEHESSKIRLEYLKNYDNYHIFGTERKVAVVKDGKWGLIDFNGEITYPLVLDSIIDLCKSRAIIQSENKYTLIPLNSSATDLDSFDWYSNISPFVNGKTIIEDGLDNTKKSYYLYNTNLPDSTAWKKLPYDFISFKDLGFNRYFCKDNKRGWGIINGESELIIEPIYKDLIYYSNGLTHVTTMNGKEGYMNDIGRVIIPAIYEDVSVVSEGLVRVKMNNLYGYLNLRGEEVIPIIYKSADDFSEGLACVSNDSGLYGYIDENGKQIIPFKYKLAREFKEGLAAVTDVNYRWGFINKGNKVIIPFKYEMAWSFSDGLAKVENKEQNIGYIDKNGQLVIPYNYWSGKDFKDGKAEVMYPKGKWGIIDKKGNLISLNQ